MVEAFYGFQMKTFKYRVAKETCDNFENIFH